LADQPATPEGTSDSATRNRVTLVCVVLAVTAIALVPLALLWPGGSNSGSVLDVGDVRPIRQAWWAMLMSSAALTMLNTPAQAVVVVSLVRGRSAGAATWGAMLMWIGAALEAVGIAGFAMAYFFPSDPSLDAATSAAVFDSIGNDHVHLLAFQLPGHLLLTAGIVVQAVALFRSRAVPRWVPIASLFILVTYAVPGSGAFGVVTTVPLAAASLGIAYYGWQRYRDHRQPTTP
jgi:hypothetical protein